MALKKKIELLFLMKTTIPAVKEKAPDEKIYETFSAEG
jgi:hypothetical protein